MELLAYLTIFIAALMFSTCPIKIKNPKAFFLIWIILSGLLSFSIRTSGFDVDTAQYARSLAYQNYDFYYLKEPVIWLGMRIVYSFLGDEILTFVFFDLISFVVIFFAFKRLGTPQYVYLSFLIFFPIILGLQNIYRQYYAMIFLMYSLSMIKDNQIRAYLFFILGVLSHNSAAIFLPLLTMQTKSRYISLITGPLLVIILILLPYSAGMKSQDATGLSLGPAYVSLIFILFTYFIAANDFLIDSKNRTEVAFFFVTLLISLTATVSISSAGAERISMFVLVFCYPLIALSIERKFTQKLALRILFISASFLPIFLVDGVRQFVIPA